MLGSNRSRASRSLNNNFPLASQHDCRAFRGRVAMRETAANGSAVANLIVRHMPDRLVQQGMILTDLKTALDIAPPRQRTDRQPLIIEPDRREIREPSDIDQGRRRGETIGQ